MPGGFDLPVIIEKKIIGGGRRENCICPRCYSTDRDRLINLYIGSHIKLSKEKLKMLHIAPSGSLKAFFTSLDNIDYQAGTKYHEGFYYSKETMILDITNLAFEDNRFDIIMCNHVLEHVNDDNKAMQELYRVLKPGGLGILQVPISAVLNQTYENPDIIDPKDREEHFGQFDHVRLYGADYPEKLKKVGFEVKLLKPNENSWIIDNIDYYAVNPNEVLYVVSKNLN